MILTYKENSIALDFDDAGNFLSGWCGLNKSENASFWVSKLGSTEFLLELNVSRLDVVEAGYSELSLCGFYLPPEISLKIGDIVKIRRVSAGGDQQSYSWLVGDRVESFRQFDELEFPRNDFGVCDLNVTEILETQSTMTLLKTLLVRLRRGSRGLGGRGPFVPHLYDDFEGDFELFKKLVFEGSQAIRETFDHSSRHLFSINDTFVDCDKTLGRYTSLLVHTFMMWERGFQTVFLAQNKSNENPLIKNVDGQLPYWGRLSTHQLSSDDALDVFLNRVISGFSETSYWFHWHLLIKTMSEDQSLHNKILSASTDYQQTWGLFLPIVQQRLSEAMFIPEQGSKQISEYY